MDFRSCWLASRAAGFPGRPVLQTQSPASMTSHSWALLPMLGLCGVGPWGPGGGQATRNSWLREWAGGEELALAQVLLCTGRLRLTGSVPHIPGSPIPSLLRGIEAGSYPDRQDPSPGFPHFLLGTEPALTSALPQHPGSRRTEISIGSRLQ